MDAEEWYNLHLQQNQAPPIPTSTSSSRKRQDTKQQQPLYKPVPIVYESLTNVNAAVAKALKEDFILNVRAPIQERDPEEDSEPVFGEQDVEGGEYNETEEEFEQRMEEWNMRQEEAAEEALVEKTPGSVAFYQIKLRDETRGWEAISSIKSVS